MLLDTKTSCDVVVSLICHEYEVDQVRISGSQLAYIIASATAFGITFGKIYNGCI